MLLRCADACYVCMDMVCVGIVCAQYGISTRTVCRAFGGILICRSFFYRLLFQQATAPRVPRVYVCSSMFYAVRCRLL